MGRVFEVVPNPHKFGWSSRGRTQSNRDLGRVLRSYPKFGPSMWGCLYNTDSGPVLRVRSIASDPVALFSVVPPLGLF